MKFIIALFVIISPLSFTTAPPQWQNDFEKAKQTALAEHKYILLNFSGSDWCIPCIRMHKEIFESTAFSDFADKELVLVNADFPRLKKNQLSKEQQKQNDGLADRYNTNGDFPLTVLLAADGKIIKKWDGFPKEGAEEFTGTVKQLIHGSNN